MYKGFILLFFLVATLFISNQIFAQGVTTAALNGVVNDTEGSPLPGANIIAEHIPSGVQYGASSRENGDFNLPNLRVGGPYTITVSFVGYTSQTKEDIHLQLGQNFRVEFQLADESVTIGEVLVTAEQDNDLNSDRTGAATSITLAEIEQLPTIQRSIRDYTRLTPQASGLSFGGRNEYYNNFSLDGSLFNN